MRPCICDSSPWPSTKVVSSLLATTRRALPKSSTVTESSFLPTSSLMTTPPVRMAMSSSIAFLLSPNPGALTPKTFKVPRSLLTTKVARASPSISSAIITTFLPICSTFSKAGNRSLTADTFLSVMRM